MLNPMTFGEYLTELLRRRHISVADLARRMDYRSKTSISRLLRDEVRFASIEDFMHRLKPVSGWLFSDEDMEGLQQAMEVSRVGRARYQAYRNIWRLVGKPCGERRTVAAECCGTASVRTLREAAQLWSQAEKLDILLLNSGYESLFRELADLLNGRPEMDCTIRHYLVMQDAPGAIAGEMGALMNVLHDPRYQGYYRVQPAGEVLISDGRNVSLHIAVIRAAMPDGQKLIQVISMHSEDHCTLWQQEGAGEFLDFCLKTMEQISTEALPLKTEYSCQNLIEGLLMILRRYYSYERDRSIFCLAPNICFELIPVEILYRVMFDSVLKGWPADDAQVLELVDIHRARYDNVHERKKKSTYIFSWESLRHFAETGRTTDHVAGMRNFTPEERAAILTDVADKCEKNEYLNVHVLRAGIPVRGMTLTAHDGLGVYLLDSYTQYDVVNGHSEAFILMPDMAGMLREFMEDELLEKHVCTQEESIAYLRNLAAQLLPSV